MPAVHSRASTSLRTSTPGSGWGGDRSAAAAGAVAAIAGVAAAAASVAEAAVSAAVALWQVRAGSAAQEIAENIKLHKSSED